MNWLRKLFPWFFVMLLLLVPYQVQAKEVTLSWDPSPTEGVQGYKVYVGQSEQMIPILEVIDVGNVLTAKISNLEDSEEHWFAVTALKDSNESSYSNVVHSPVVEKPNTIFDWLDDFSINVEVQ